jgi:hypothetical protein
MNERVFLAFRGLAILIHCFPGLGPSERHTQCVLCLLVDQKLALRWTDISREKALFLYSEITADLPHTRRLLHSPRHLPLAYSEVTPLSVQDVPPEWVLGGCTFPLLYHVLDLRTFHSTSCLGLLLTRDLFWSCPGLLDVVEQGRGDLEGRLGALVLREAYAT